MSLVIVSKSIAAHWGTECTINIPTYLIVLFW